MDIDQVFELIRQNGVGQDIKCFFSSKDEDKEKDFMCLIHNYKYNNGMIKLYIDQYGLQEHEKILDKFPDCELLIKKEEKKQSLTVRLFCKFLRIENRFIFVKAFNIKYLNSEGKETNHRI